MSTLNDLQNRFGGGDDIYNKATGTLNRAALGVSQPEKKTPTTTIPSPQPQPTQRPQGGMIGGRLAGGNDATIAATPALTTPPQTSAPTAETQTGQTKVTTPPTESTVPKPKTYKELIDEYGNTYKPMTPEEMEKQRKRHKAQASISAVGDAISALSNLYFTYKGAPSSYNPANTLSGKVKERWDSLQAKQEANKEKYLAYLLRERDFDVNEQRYKAQQEQHKADVERQDRYHQESINAQNRSFDFQKEQARKADERNARLDQESTRRFDINANEQKRQFDRTMAAQEKRDNDKNTYYTTKLAADALKAGQYGKPLAFSGSDNQTYKVYMNVWKANYAQMYADMVKEGTITRTRLQNRHGAPTTSEMENAVKANWDKSEVGRLWMSKLSKYTPEGNTTSQHSGSPFDDETEQDYTSGDGAF